jgi:hypothetical protein
MARHQIKDRPAITQVFGPVVLAADNTPVALDTRGFDNIQFLIGVGIGGITFDSTNKIEIILKHGDDTTVGNHTAVASTDIKIYDDAEAAVAMVTGGIVWQLIAANAAAKSRRVDYFGSKRYLSVLVDFSGTHGTGTPVYAQLLTSYGAVLPPV